MTERAGAGSQGDRPNKFPASSNALGASASGPGGAARETASSVADAAKDLASQAGQKVISAVEDQKAAGADFVSGMAGAIRRAANEFGQVPQAAQYMKVAADQIDNVSDAFRRRDLNQLVADVQGFARRQPTAFLGAAVLAGFAAVRFLKTSTATGASASSQSEHPLGGPQTSSGYQPRQSSSAASRQTGT
jgi:hypothetical protein